MRKTREDDTAGFGKRSRPKVVVAERRPTSIERLKQIGKRLWGKKPPAKKKNPWGLGFKRSRLDP